MIKIVVDSGCDLNEKISKENNIVSVPLQLQVDQKIYRDDESLDIDKLLEEMEASPNPCRTAAPSPQDFLDKYMGDEDIFVVNMTSKLSGSYNSALNAKQIYLDEIGKKFIHVFDSLSASVGETLVALKISELDKLNLAKEKIINCVDDFISNMHTFFIFEKFDNFVKNGRMNPYIANLANLFSIKPICKAQNGIVALAGKARGYTKAAEKLVKMISECVIEPEKKILAIAHVKCKEKAIKLKDDIMKLVSFKDVIILETSGLCSVYGNRGGIIVAF